MAPTPSIAIDFEDRPIPAVPGEPVAVALWRAGERALSRSVKYHRPRGLSCFEEACAGCLVRIEGLPNRFACTTPCREGLRVDRQNAFPDASHDLLRAVDFSFPRTFNHHEMLAGVPVLSAVMAKVARQLAGLGALPSSPTGPGYRRAQERAVETLVIGLGRAGQRQAAALGPRDLAIEGSPLELGLVGSAPTLAARAIGLFLEGGQPVIAAEAERLLLRLRPQRVVLCSGSRAQLPVFPGSDLPGVLTDRAAARLLRFGVLPDRRVRVGGETQRARAIGAALAAAGAEVEVLPPEAELTHRRRATLVVAGPLAPAFELAGQAGAALRFVPGRGFAVRTDAGGQTSISWLSAFGSCAVVA